MGASEKSARWPSIHLTVSLARFDRTGVRYIAVLLPSAGCNSFKNQRAAYGMPAC
jgi:hypothetical protein